MGWWIWNVWIFGIIPAFSVVILFLMKRSLLWAAPLISAALAFVAYCIAFAPISMAEIFSNNEWRAFFFLAMLMHIAIAAVFTGIGYIAAFVMKRRSKQ